MLTLLIFGLVLSAAVDVGQCASGYRRFEGGWLKTFKQIRTWRDAVAHCQNDGAVLASPLNSELLSAMSGMLEENLRPVEYFIGVHAEFHQDRFVSIEGVPLDDMAGAYLSGPVGPGYGRCMSIDNRGIHTVPCSYRMPFMCYKKDTPDEIMTKCGTNDKEYKLVASTGSCYKVHAEKKNWTEAYATCVDEGAYLLLLNDTKEHISVRDFIFGSNNVEMVFLGIRQLEIGGPWITVNWETAGNDVFHKTFLKGAIDKDHIHVGLFSKNGELAYDPEDHVHSFVCERDPSNLKFP